MRIVYDVYTCVVSGPIMRLTHVASGIDEFYRAKQTTPL